MTTSINTSDCVSTTPGEEESRNRTYCTAVNSVDGLDQRRLTPGVGVKEISKIRYCSLSLSSDDGIG